jgi:hypothetical protein
MGTEDSMNDDLPMELNETNMQSLNDKFIDSVLEMNSYDKDKDIDYSDFF